MRLVRVFILFLCLPAIAAAQGTTSRLVGQVVRLDRAPCCPA